MLVCQQPNTHSTCQEMLAYSKDIIRESRQFKWVIWLWHHQMEETGRRDWSKVVPSIYIYARCFAGWPRILLDMWSVEPEITIHQIVLIYLIRSVELVGPHCIQLMLEQGVKVINHPQRGKLLRVSNSWYWHILCMYHAGCGFFMHAPCTVWACIFYI